MTLIASWRTMPMTSGDEPDGGLGAGRRSAARFFWAWLIVATAMSVTGNVAHAVLDAPAGTVALAAGAALVIGNWRYQNTPNSLPGTGRGGRGNLYGNRRRVPMKVLAGRRGRSEATDGHPPRGSRSTPATSDVHNGAAASSVRRRGENRSSPEIAWAAIPTDAARRRGPDFLDCPPAPAGDGPRTGDRVSARARRDTPHTMKHSVRRTGWN